MTVVFVCDSDIYCPDKVLKGRNGRKRWRKAIPVCGWQGTCNHKKKMTLTAAINEFGLSRDVLYAGCKVKVKLGVIPLSALK